jgi:sulfoxide reductase heme-binding subunit YedZ
VIAASVTTWYVVRAGGLVAFLLLTATVLLGLTLSGRARLPGWPRFAVEDVHRFVGILTGTFVALHGLTLLVDGYYPFGPLDLVLPGTAPYRPVATAAGVVGAELLAALALTNHYRRRIPYRLWRAAHFVNFPVWLLALVHGVAAGTDSGTAWGLALYAIAAGSVAGALARRILSTRLTQPCELRLWPGTAAIVAAELIVALAAGPLHTGPG